MKEPYVEGAAIHDDPDSCAVTREGADEARRRGRRVILRRARHYGGVTKTGDLVGEGPLEADDGFAFGRCCLIGE